MWNIIPDNIAHKLYNPKTIVTRKDVLKHNQELLNTILERVKEELPHLPESIVLKIIKYNENTAHHLYHTYITDDREMLADNNISAFLHRRLIQVDVNKRWSYLQKRIIRNTITRNINKKRIKL